MKQLTWKLILPLTVISFTVFTKWWYVLPVDGPDTMMVGFPLPYTCNGWHTSLSLQIFLTELCIDVLTYLSFWFSVVFSIERFLTKINLSKVATILLLSTSGLCICGLTLFAFNPDNLFFIKRPFDIEVLTTGYKFIWDGNTQPENFDEYERSKSKLSSRLFDTPDKKILRYQCDDEGLRQAEIYSLDGNAVTNPSIHVSVHLNCNSEERKDEKLVFTADNNSMTDTDVNINWLTSDTLLIEYKKGLRIFTQLNSIKYTDSTLDLHVKYKELE